MQCKHLKKIFLYAAKRTLKFVRFKFNILWRACSRSADTETHSSVAHRKFIVFLRKFPSNNATSPPSPWERVAKA